ncbi:MAG: hypothetical protein LBN23_06495, partial [Paludibacter sp.]|nr:hypothetical protein [Paludibacter sp.]
MNKYLNFFLKINRWQLFCLLIVLPYILNILLVINIETGAYLPVPVFLISFLFVIAFLSWLYS